MKQKQKKIMSTSGARTRRHELVDLGLVKWNGLKRANSKGRACRVWRSLSEEEWMQGLDHAQLGLDDVISERRAVARSTDPQTSWEAAKGVKNIRQSQRQIYNILIKHGPMIDEEIYDKIMEDYQHKLL